MRCGGVHAAEVLWQEVLVSYAACCPTRLSTVRRMSHSMVDHKGSRRLYVLANNLRFMSCVIACLVQRGATYHCIRMCSYGEALACV